MPVAEGAGVELAFESAGDGPAVVLVHGMAADRAAMAPDAAALAPHARVLTYDRRGYGGSGAPDPYERTSVAEQAEDLVALLRATGAQGAVAGAVDFGGLVVLDVLLRHPRALRGAVLVDVPALQLTADAMEPLAAERLALEDALRDGGRERAVEIWLAARGVGDPGRRAAARRDAAAFFADYGGQATLALTRRELRALRAARPARRSRGERARPRRGRRRRPARPRCPPGRHGGPRGRGRRAGGRTRRRGARAVDSATSWRPRAPVSCAGAAASSSRSASPSRA